MPPRVDKRDNDRFNLTKLKSKVQIFMMSSIIDQQSSRYTVLSGPLQYTTFFMQM